MAHKEINNLFLINAPAGSGKTTFIEKEVLKILENEPTNQILCITYTKRATEELNSRIDSNQITISTIHSFLSEFIDLYSYKNEVVELYFDIYNEEIVASIEEKSNSGEETIKNKKYIEKYEKLDLSTLRTNLTTIKYNELEFNSLYYGGLSHDDLLSFTYHLMQKFPVLKKRISDKYDYIFVDEYQDTSAFVLEIFHESVKETSCQLYLLGDKMQEIYDNYDGSFESKLGDFDTTQKLSTNYRSSKKIINVLNNLYNDTKFHQNHNLYSTSSSSIPKLIIYKDFEAESIQSILKNPSVLKLYVFNRERFKGINALNLYNAVRQMDYYSFPSKYSALDVLTDRSNDNPDKLFRLLFQISSIVGLYEKKEYGSCIQQIRKSRLFEDKIMIINIHNDKLAFSKILEFIVSQYKSKISIKKFLDTLIKSEIIVPNNFSEIFTNPEYSSVLDVSVEEIFNLVEYLDKPMISTQHGVKGEGHTKVCFLCENSANPSVKMFEFLRLLSKKDMSVTLTGFQEFAYQYVNKVKDTEMLINQRISDLKAPSFTLAKNTLVKKATQINEVFCDNKYYQFLIADKYQIFLKNPNVGNIKNAMKLSDIKGVLTAYRLFYVGCSRAKEELTVLVNYDNIQDFSVDFKEKMKSLDFQVSEI